MAEGEACDAAAAPGARNGRTPHQIARFAPDYGPVQAALRADGANIGDDLR